MFCSKCGASLSETDSVCPKCGTPNLNYLAPQKKFSVNLKKQNTDKGTFQLFWVFAPLLVIALFLTCIFFVYHQSTEPEKVAYSLKGLTSYKDKDSNACFIDGTKVISFSGVSKQGITSPDHTKYLVLCDDNQLMLYEEADDTGKLIADNASSIQRCNNQGVFYYTSDGELCYLNFSDNKSVPLGLKNLTLCCYSSGNTAVAGFDNSGSLYTYVAGDDSPKELCTVDGDVDICCVADDGSNVIWSIENDDSFSVYMMKNGVPERIGKITSTSNYFHYLYGYFFNKDNSFLVYAYCGSQIILGNDENIKEISLPGSMTYYKICTAEGKFIDSDDDVVQNFYLSLKKTTKSSTITLYQLTIDGDLIPTTEGINKDTLYKLSGGYVYYINDDNDLVRMKLDDSSSSELITTDVDSLYLSQNGNYLFIQKAGGLYVCSTSDKKFQFEMITNNFTEDSLLYITNQDDVIYFITDTESVGKYDYIGTAYKYVVGSEPKKIGDNILSFYVNDEEYVSATEPLIVMYKEANGSSDFIVDYGSIVDGDYQTLISQTNYQ